MSHCSTISPWKLVRLLTYNWAILDQSATSRSGLNTDPDAGLKQLTYSKSSDAELTFVQAFRCSGIQYNFSTLCSKLNLNTV
jgi:hypothetical protein